MDVFVERAPVHRAVRPVVPCVLQYEEDGDLVGHLVERGKGDAGREANILAHGMEEPRDVSEEADTYGKEDRPNLRKLDSEMAEENEGGALPLFVGGGYFIL